MAKVDVVHDAHGNILGFTLHAEGAHKTGVKAQEGQTLTTLEISGHPKEDPQRFTAAVHSDLRKRIQG